MAKQKSEKSEKRRRYQTVRQFCTDTGLPQRRAYHLLAKHGFRHYRVGGTILIDPDLFAEDMQQYLQVAGDPA